VHAETLSVSGSYLKSRDDTPKIAPDRLSPTLHESLAETLAAIGTIEIE
jgi:hypothetical protein